MLVNTLTFILTRVFSTFVNVISTGKTRPARSTCTREGDLIFGGNFTACSVVLTNGGSAQLYIKQEVVII